jgi:hypothetical protein
MLKIIIIIFLLHELGRLTCSGNDALPSFPRASTISSSRFVVEGVFRESPDCLHLVVVGGIAGLSDLTGYAGGNFMSLVGPPKPGQAVRERPN